MKLPYYAVIFTSKRTEVDENYSEMATKMVEAIKNWKQNLDHLDAQQLGVSKWYENYTVRIALVEKEYSFEK